MEDHFAVLYAELDQQFERLLKLQQAILYWLTIEREVVSLQMLQENLVQPASGQELQEVLWSLQQKHLIEVTDHGFSLQNAMLEYLTNRLVAQICDEMSTGTLVLLQ